MAFYLHHPIPQASADQCQKGDQPTGSPRGGKAKQVEHWIPPAFLKAEGPAEGPEGPAAPHRTQITGEFSIAETPETEKGKAIHINQMASDTTGYKLPGLRRLQQPSPSGPEKQPPQCPVPFTTKDVSVQSCRSLLAKEPAAFHH